VGKFADQVTVISMTWGWPTPLLWRCRRGVSLYEFGALVALAAFDFGELTDERPGATVQ